MSDGIRSVDGLRPKGMSEGGAATVHKLFCDSCLVLWNFVLCVRSGGLSGSWQ